MLINLLKGAFNLRIHKQVKYKKIQLGHSRSNYLCVTLVLITQCQCQTMTLVSRSSATPISNFGRTSEMYVKFQLWGMGSISQL